MPDLQRLIDDIRFRLQSQDWELTEELRTCADEYVGICRDVNNRLRRCGEFLKQGLRSEAVHLADSQPPLLELLATVDFPERGSWEEMVAFYQLPKPDPLLLDVAEQLNEAYALQQPLEKVLDRHRLLALQRAPLAQRLTILRKIAEVDRSNPVWADDVRVFEKARLTEIEHQAQAAANGGDGAALVAACAELSQPGWRETPSKGLVQRVRRLSDEVVRHTARAELEALEPELNAAFGALDAPKARLLRDKWNVLASKAQLPAGDALGERVAPALGWLGDDDGRVATDKSYQAAVAALERTLENHNVEADEIRRAGHAVLKHERDLPEVLRMRYEQRLQSLDLTAQRRQRLIIGASIAAVVTVIGAMAIMVNRVSTAQSVGHVTATARQFVTDGKLKEASELLNRHAEYAHWPEWLEAHGLLTDAEGQEQDRIVALQQALGAARNAVDPATALARLGTARQHARLPHEKLEVLSLEERWQKVAGEARAAQEAGFQSQLKSLAETVKHLEQLHGQGALNDEFLRLLGAAERELVEIRPLLKSIAASFTTQLKVVESRLEAVRQAGSGIRRRGAIFDELTKLSDFHPEVPDADAKLQKFGELAREFSTGHADDARAADFGAAASAAEALRGMIHWQRISNSWKDKFPPSAAIARARLAECRNWLERYDKSPDARLVREYADYLRSVAAREADAAAGDEEGVRQKLLELFSGPLVDGIYCIETNAGAMYYVEGEQSFAKGSNARFQAIVGYDGAFKTKSKILPVADLKFDRSRPAPQSEIALRVRKDLPGVSIDGWDDYLGRLAEMIYSDKRIDGLLKHFLLSRTLESAGDANSLLKIELQAILSKLDDEKINLTAKWVDPDDVEAAGARRKAANAIGLLERNELSQAWGRAEARETKLAADVRRRIVAIGWLAQEGGKWQVRTNASVRQPQQLLVAVPATAEGTTLIWAGIGTAEPAMEVRLEESSSAAFRWGRIVFAADTPLGE